jgi:phage terminase large subunit-like protein
LGRQERDAELLEDTPGALRKLSDIEAARIPPTGLPTLRRVVVAIDPAVSNNENSDETGIIVAGRADRARCRLRYNTENLDPIQDPK